MAASAADVMLRRHIVVQRLAANQVTKVDKFLRDISTELQRRLSGQDLTTLTRSRLERTLDRVNSYVGDSLQTYQKSLLRDLQAIGANEADFTEKAQTQVVPDFTGPAPATIRAAILSTPLSVSGPDGGNLLESFIEDWTGVERKRVTGAIRLGVAQGQTNAQIVQAIRGTAAKKYADGILALTKRNADSIVNTAVQFVANVARQEVFAANEDVVEQVQWLATLDNRTCPVCGALDGQTFDLDDGPRPPLHINCRCTTLSVLSSKFAKFQRGGQRPAVGDDGAEQLPAGTTYFSWLKTQPADFQDFAIGPTRGKLLRDGGLSADQFAQLQLDKRFQPITLDEARKLDPLAFDKAGLDS